MVFLFLHIVCNLLVVQSIALFCAPFNRKMPGHAAAFYIVFGAAVGIFAWITAVFSLATFLDGIK